MNGLLNNNLDHVLTQWHNIFIKQSLLHSIISNNHWLSVKNLGITKYIRNKNKYFSINKLLTHNFQSANPYVISITELNKLSFVIDAYRIVFVNGIFNSKLSDKNIGQWKIKIEQGTNRKTNTIPIKPELFLHLIESLSQNLTLLRLPAGKIETRPLYIIHINNGTNQKTNLSTINYRHHIDIEDEANGSIIEHFTSTTNIKANFSGARTSINLKNKASLTYQKLIFENNNSYHLSHNDIFLHNYAIMHSNTITLGPIFTRQQTSVQLNGKNTDLSINSLMVSSGKDTNETYSYIEHNNTNSRSRQLHKIIVCNDGQGCFNGLIKVAKKANKSNSKIINNNLLLDRVAKVYTKPHLEIYADDIKCSHGVTVGYINKDQIFYLQTRGINHHKAQWILIHAFAAKIIDHINDKNLRNIVINRINTALQRKKHDISN